MKPKYIVVSIAALCAIVALVAYLHGAYIPVLEPAGPIALAERNVIVITILLSGIIVVPVFFLLFFFAWKYRADSPNAQAQHRPDWDHDNIAAEFIWWLVPTAIIAILAVVAWQSSHALDPYVPIEGSGSALTIEVVALDWKWLFIYPQQNIASVNMLEFPENSPVHFELTADAPMNSFWIPSLGGQIMVMPGMTTQLNLMASQLGSFQGFSANISGRGFSGMAFTARSVSQRDFDDWVQAVQNASSTPLSLSTYDALAAPSEYNPVTEYSPVDPDLYAAINMKYMVPQNETMNGMPTNNPAP